MIPTSLGNTIFVALLLGVVYWSQVSCFSQDELAYIASNLEIQYEVLDNLAVPQTYTSRLTLTNRGEKEIKRGPWAIYFNFIRLVEPKHLMNNPSGYILPSAGVKLAHITGSLFKLEPVQDFLALPSGQNLTFEFEASDFSVARTDVMPNWYIAAEGLQALNIAKTTGEDLKFVGKFDTKEKWKRTKDDRYNPFTPEERLERVKVEKRKPNPVSIIPTPVELNVEDQKVDINGWVILTPVGFQNEAKYLGEKLKLNIVTDTGNFSDAKILRLLQENVDVTVGGEVSASEERYKVDVNAKGNKITISAPTASGIFYGIQSLLAVTDVKNKQVFMVSLKDAPRFGYRGLMLDISRNFHGKTSIIKIMDVMGMYKLNKLHLHLTDDEGWRLELPGLKELTNFGGQRCHDTDMCLAPQIGSGATTGTSGTGYLTVQDYKEILQHAKALHIEVIPEFDMPGHSHAAIKAMEQRFLKNNASTNETVRKDASKFLLTEPGDPSSYFSIQMFRDNAVNPCLNSTYDFIEHALSTLVNLHKDISPLRLFHMGGDEVASGAWVNSTACQKLAGQIKERESLKEYFTKRLSEITGKYNVSFAAWEDGLLDKGQNLIFNKDQLSNGSVFGYAWDNVWEWGAFDRAYRLANAGYKTVLAHATHLYFDMPYEPDPEERGYYWATRFTDTKKTFGYMPDNVYANAKEERTGKPINEAELCKEANKCPPLVKKSNIEGIQGHLWSETVRTEDQLFYMCFPRVLALAERAWHKANFEKDNNEKSRESKLNMEWQAFANSLGYQELIKLDEMGVNYRVPLPGAKVESGKLVASSAFPGLKIEYKAAEESGWKEYTSAELKLEGKIRLRTKSADGKRSSREIGIIIDASVSHGTQIATSLAFIPILMFVLII